MGTGGTPGAPTTLSPKHLQALRQRICGETQRAERGYAGADGCLDGWAGWEAPVVPRSGYGERPAVGRPYNESGLVAAEEDLAGEQMVAKPYIEDLDVAVLTGATGAAVSSVRVVCGVGGRLTRIPPGETFTPFSSLTLGQAAVLDAQLERE